MFISTNRPGWVSIGWREQNNYMKWKELYPEAPIGYKLVAQVQDSYLYEPVSRETIASPNA